MYLQMNFAECNKHETGVDGEHIRGSGRGWHARRMGGPGERTLSAGDDGARTQWAPLLSLSLSSGDGRARERT